MSSQAMVVIDDKDKPTNIPDFLTIITQCFALGPQQATATNISGVRIALYKTSDHDASNIWVKFGSNITMGEAKTQCYVVQYLRDSNNTAVRAPRVYLAFTWSGFGFIVSEYIDGQICDNSDIALIAAAVQALINIPSTDLKPGPVGGGLIEHPFFVDRESSIEYESVEELEDHINGILSVTGRKGRVSFHDELANGGLRLCVSDLKLVNFMKDRDGRIVAVDFGGYSFLPPSFFAFALKQGNFALRLAGMLRYPPSTNVAALVSASCALAPYSSNDI
ncbi:hypothetical protein FRC00_006960, partial [Tulasnella sp. 408]